MKIPATYLLLLFAFLSTTVFSQDPNFYIFLSFGQSNMEGQGTIEDQDKSVDSRFQMMSAVSCTSVGRTMGTWSIATPPTCRCGTGLSPVDYFGRTMVANLPSNVRVGIINVSVAGCKIELFDKLNYTMYTNSGLASWMTSMIAEYGGNPYGRLVEIAKLAQKDGVIKGILLHQGESNTGENSTWPAKVKGIYDNLITDLSLSASKVPLLAGEVVDAAQGGICAAANSMIALLPQTIPNAHVISSSGCTDATDNLHFNSAGYRELGTRYATKMLSLLGVQLVVRETESFWFEAERFAPKLNSKFNIVSDALASNNQYVTAIPGTQSLAAATSDSSTTIIIPFKANQDTTYHVFGRLNCATFDDDSYWVKMDASDFVMCNGLKTTGWSWLKLNSYLLNKGNHTLTITYREDGAFLDKVAISSDITAPTGMGSAETAQYGIRGNKAIIGDVLGKTITFDLPFDSHVSMGLYNLSGILMKSFNGVYYNVGKHTVQLDYNGISKGIYLLKLEANSQRTTCKVVL